LRALLATAALAGAVFAVVGPASPASAFFHPMPPPTGPHHAHPEKNPSRAEFALLTPKQKTAIVRSGGTLRRAGNVRCVRNCGDPRALSRPTLGGERIGHRAAASTGTIWCSWYWVGIFTANVTGAKIWQFNMRTDYCWNDATGMVVSHHTAVHPVIYSWASFLGWEYKGTTEVSAWRPFGDASAVRTYAQGHFSFCPPRIWCVQTKYPYAYIDVYGTGDRMVSKWGV
jgi:hypothetical protein